MATTLRFLAIPLIFFGIGSAFAQGYQPEFGLSALRQGQERANQEALTQQQMQMNQLQIMRMQQQIIEEIRLSIIQKCTSLGLMPETKEFQTCRAERAEEAVRQLQASGVLK